MKSIMLSIHPEFAEMIMEGSKLYEFRTRVAKAKVGRIILYATGPTSEVIGEVQVREVIRQSPEELWRMTCRNAGISRERFFDYFQNRDLAYAYSLFSPVRFRQPRKISEYGLNSAPQSFVYLS